MKDIQGHCIMIKGSIQEEDIAFKNSCEPNLELRSYFMFFFLFYILKNVIFQCYFIWNNYILGFFFCFKLFRSLNFLYSEISIPKSLAFHNHLIQLMKEQLSVIFPLVGIFIGTTEFINYFGGKWYFNDI